MKQVVMLNLRGYEFNNLEEAIEFAQYWKLTSDCIETMDDFNSRFVVNCPNFKTLAI